MADLFISYASEDRARVAPVVGALEEAGWKVWWDRDLIAGPDFSDSIQNALDTALCVVVVWSRHSVESNWVRDEAQEGMQRHSLVPCRIDDVRPPLGFRSLQTISLIGWPEQQDGLPDLLEAVRASLAVTTAASEDRSAGAATQRVTSDNSGLDERSIAVLPFTNLSSDSEQQYFCDGLVEDIITDLSYVKPLVVISRNSSFAYRSNAPDIRRVAGELHVKYVLLGSVRRSGKRIRVSTRLVDGRTEETVWSKRYDREVEDLFELQDDLTNQIVTALDVNLVSGERGKRYQQHRNSDARELLYRGMFEFRKFEQSASSDARRYFKQFIDAEPDSVEGYSWLVLTAAFAIVVGWEAPQEALPQLREWVDRALAVDSDDGHALVGDGIYRVIAGDLSGAYQSLQRAVEVEPNLDDAWFYRGWTLMFMGEADAAVDSLQRAMRLSPIPNSIRFGVLGTALRNAGRYEEAVATFEECLRRFPDFVYARVSLSIVYGMMGDQEAAEREVQRTLSVDPHYSVQRFVNPNLYSSPSVMAQCAKTLRNAGLPEH